MRLVPSARKLVRVQWNVEGTIDVEAHAQIMEILDSVKDMTIATIRSDGFPHATVVAFVHDDLRLYFATALASQKARNIVMCNKISATITLPYARWGDIEGLSLGGYASEVTNQGELRAAQTLLTARFPETVDVAPEMIGEIGLFRVDPVVISLIDYTKGFGHTELIEIEKKLSA